MPNNQPLKPVDRRTFLKSSAVITATTALAGPPAIVSAQSLKNAVNYGFIGSGRQGSNHLKHLATVTTGRCAVICDIYPPNLKKGGFLFKILQEVFRNINMTIDNHKLML